MPIANAAQNVAAQPRKPYQPPQLTVFGPLSKLTQNGNATVRTGTTINIVTFDELQRYFTVRAQ